MVHLTEKEIANQIAHSHNDRSNDIIVSQALCITIALLAVAMRFMSRLMGGVRLGADDYMIVAGFVFAVGEATSALICKSLGSPLETNLYASHTTDGP